MIRPIYLYGEPILNQAAIDIDLKDPELKTIVDDMFETMYNAKGAGLAAPQIGISKRIIVVDEKLEEEDGIQEEFKEIFINPKILIVEHLGFNILTEGCLSVPGVSGRVVRPATIILDWYDLEGNHHNKMFHGMKARIIQHEYDHLEGILYTNRIHPDARLGIFTHLQDIKNKKVKPIYEVV